MRNVLGLDGALSRMKFYSMCSGSVGRRVIRVAGGVNVNGDGGD